jgi:hypothetical protein
MALRASVPYAPTTAMTEELAGQRNTLLLRLAWVQMSVLLPDNTNTQNHGMQ